MTLNGPSERRRRRAAGGGVMPPPQKTLFASGSQGVTAPWSRNLKNASPWIRTLGERRADTRALTVDFPAPGGPAMTSKDDIDTASHERQYRPQTDPLPLARPSSASLEARSGTPGGRAK